MARKGKISRKTKETSISVEVNIFFFYPLIAHTNTADDTSIEIGDMILFVVDVCKTEPFVREEIIILGAGGKAFFGGFFIAVVVAVAADQI